MDKDVQSVTQADYGMADQYRDRHGLNGLNRDHLADLIAQARLASQPTSAEDATMPIPVWDVREVEDCGHRGMKGYEVLLPDGTWTDVAAHNPEDAIATANLDWRASRPTPDTQTAAMRDALEPFANEASEYDLEYGSGQPDFKGAPDASSLNEANDLTVGDLRRARSAILAALQPEKTK